MLFRNFRQITALMKKLLIIAIAFAGISSQASSQTKPILTATIKTPNALCESCKSRIETYLKRYDGVLEVNVNYRKAETKVKYITDRINIEEIKAAIANAGYDADDVETLPEIYNRLPKSCKKFEDGGGHPKPKTLPQQ